MLSPKPFPRLALAAALLLGASAALAPRASAADLTAQLVNLGNPHASDGKTGRARSIWDMQAFDGRVFLGGGSTVDNPGANGIFAFDPAANALVREATYASEAIERLRVIDGRLYLPASDPTQNDNLKFAVRSPGSPAWSMVSHSQVLAHVRDLALLGTDLVGVGNSRDPINQPNAFRTTTAPGATFRSVGSNAGTLQERNMFQSMLTYQGVTYATSLKFTRVSEQSYNINDGLLYRHNGIARYDPVGKTLVFDEPLITVDPTTSVDDEDFLPVRSYSDEEFNTGMRFSGSVEFGGVLLYTLRATSAHPDYYTAKYMKTEGLFFKTALQGPPTSVSFPGASAAVGEDLLVVGDQVLALTNQPVSGGGFTVRVFRTTTPADNASWVQLFHFTSPNRVKSFEYLYGLFYFGLGADHGETLASAGALYQLAYTDPALPAPAAPSAFARNVVAHHRIDFTWTAPASSSLAGYELQRRTLPDGPWISLTGPAASATSASDLTAQEATTYAYRLRAHGLGGASAWTAELTATTPAKPAFDLLFHHRLDETSGNTAADSSGNGFGATFTTTPSWGTGKLGNAATFSTNGERGLVPDTPLLNGMDKLTVSLWVRPTNLNNGSNARFLVSKRTASTDAVFSLFFFTENRLFVDLGTNNDRWSSTTTFANNTWYHLALVYDGSLPQAERARLYVNGVLDRIAPETETVLGTNSAPVWIGQSSTGASNNFNGSLDDVRLYRRALDPDQIARLPADRLHGPGTLAAWRDAHFTAAQLADPLVSGPAAAPAGDGVANLLKYHLGLDPWTPAGPAALPRSELSPAGDVLTLAYRRVRYTPDVVATVQWSETLAADAWSAEGVTRAVVAQTDTHEDVEAHVPLAGRPRLFLRLHVAPVN